MNQGNSNEFYDPADPVEDLISIGSPPSEYAESPLYSTENLENISSDENFSDWNDQGSEISCQSPKYQPEECDSYASYSPIPVSPSYRPTTPLYWKIEKKLAREYNEQVIIIISSSDEESADESIIYISSDESE